MKFRVSSKTLYSYLSAVSKIINAKNTLSILNTFKLSLEGNELTITASDGDNFLEGRLTVSEAEGSGSVCIEARRLVDLFKELPDVGVEVTVDTDALYDCQVRYASGEYRLPGIAGDEFPKADPDAEGSEVLSFTLPSSNIIRSIDRTIFAVSDDELRPYLMGQFWDVKEDKVVWVATDGRKLVKFVDSTVAPGGEASFILSVKSLTVIKNVFARQGDVKVTLREKGVCFSSADYTFNTRFIVGNFPPYERVIPKDNPYQLTVERGAFQSALRRITPFCEAVNGLVRFKITSDKMVMKAAESAGSGSGWESTPCQYEGTDLVIGFSAPWVSEILNAIPSQNVVSHLSDPSHPGIFEPEENEEGTELVMLLMPMLVNEF